MPATEHSIADLVKDALRDAQELVRTEIALARTEMRQEARRVGAGAVALAGAALAGVLALVFLLTTVAWALSELLLWPVWAGFGVVTVFAVVVAAVLAVMGRRRLAGAPHLPLTADTMKENMKWMRARTS
jgi:hypothetical protein